MRPMQIIIIAIGKIINNPAASFVLHNTCIREYNSMLDYIFYSW